jgi:ubiquitin-like modifier-activating enzyme ATG7
MRKFEQLVIKGRSYDCCSACSKKVIDLYKSEGWAFVKRCLNEQGYVEEVSGLKELQRQAEAAEAAMEAWSDDEGGDEFDAEGEII